MLYIDRLKKIALFVYKCFNNIGPSSVHNICTAKPVPYSFRDSHKAKQPNVKSTTFGLNSIKYSDASLWNKLPSNLKEAVDLSTF